MNNEVAHNLNNYTAMPQTHSRINMQSSNNPIQEETQNAQDCANQMQNSMEFLGNINRAALNTMDKSVLSSTVSFLANPDYAQHYNDLYDSLIERGYSAQQALEKCDEIMLALKNKNTYKQ